MTMRRDDEAGREFEAEHERPLLRRAAQQDGGLGAGRQRRRRRPPFDGVGGHDGVVRIGGVRGRDGAEDRGGAKRQGDED